MNIVLVCNAGMSTSVLVQKMEKAAKARELEVKITACSIEVLEEMISTEKVDVIMVGPQIRHMMPNLKKIANGVIPLDLIDMRDYGMMDGEKVLNKAIELIEKN